jgi:hypothetical protein
MSFASRVPGFRPGRFLLLGLLASLPARAAAPRRIAIRVPEALLSSAALDLERLKGSSERGGAVLDVGPEGAPAPSGAEVLRLALIPVSETFAKSLSRFPLILGKDGFIFDGRDYRAAGDAISLADPGKATEIFVVGNSSRAVARLAGRRLSLGDEAPDYLLVSSGLTKEGRFGKGTVLGIDRASDRDGISAREAFFTSRKSELKGGVTWLFREEERPAAEHWAGVLKTFSRGDARRAPLTVAVFPDAATKAKYTGSSRPADLFEEGGGFRVDLDAAALFLPDLISPVLAAAALAAEQPALAKRPLLLAAAGARAFRRWWGRDVASFEAFARGAGVEPLPSDVAAGSPDLSPVLAIGAAASWLEAAVRLDGEPAMKKVLAGPEPALLSALERWRQAAARQAVLPPPRRELPKGFLRGVSYAMTNSIDGGYASGRSRETLGKLAALSVNAVSIMPFAFERDAASPGIAFVHREPQGETDEGTLQAVADARRAGMSAMVKPQLWVGRGGFVGRISMKSEEDWRRWFDAYRRFLVHHAVVAEAAGAALFCVGTELAGTEARENQWRRTIAAVRLATGAPLTYAANWAANAPKVPFWDALDAVGVDFYDPLGRDARLSDKTLEAGARAAARPLSALSTAAGKPVIFTEAGYPPVKGAWIAPHDEGSGRPASPEDAARAVAAVFRALEKETWWKGVYWWKAFSDGRPARAGDGGYNVIGTPSEKVIAEGFRRLSGADR